MGNNKSEKIRKIIETELAKYSFYIRDRVKFSEVDSFGVVHNVVYFYWVEWARTEYLRNLGINLNPNTYINEFPVMIARSEMEYFNPLRFGELYKTYTRISQVGDSSFKYENILTSENGVVIARGEATLVHLNFNDKRPLRIPKEIREKIRSFEGGNCRFIEK